MLSDVVLHVEPVRSSSVCLLGSKYCPLLEVEGGLTILESVAHTANPKFRQIAELAQQIIRRCAQFRLSADAPSTEDVNSVPADGPATVDDADLPDDMSEESEGVDGAMDADYDSDF